MAVWAAQMSDFQLNTEVYTGRLNIDYAWLGQFIWAVVYKPFRAQSILIDRMMMNGVMMDERGDPVSETASLEKTDYTHTPRCFLIWKVGWAGSNCSFLEYSWAKQEILLSINKNSRGS